MCVSCTARGYPNKPPECKVTFRQFLCVLLAELLPGQRTLGLCYSERKRGTDFIKQTPSAWMTILVSSLGGKRVFVPVCWLVCSVKTSIELRGDTKDKIDWRVRVSCGCLCAWHLGILRIHTTSCSPFLTSENVITALNVRIFWRAEDWAGERNPKDCSGLDSVTLHWPQMKRE